MLEKKNFNFVSRHAIGLSSDSELSWNRTERALLRFCFYHRFCCDGAEKRTPSHTFFQSINSFNVERSRIRITKQKKRKNNYIMTQQKSMDVWFCCIHLRRMKVRGIVQAYQSTKQSQIFNSTSANTYFTGQAQG